MQMEKLIGMKLKSHIPGAYTRLRGVITGAPISTSIVDIKENVKGGRVIEAKSLLSRKEGQRSESLSVLLRFEKVLAGTVQIAFSYFNVVDMLNHSNGGLFQQVIDIVEWIRGLGMGF